MLAWAAHGFSGAASSGAGGLLELASGLVFMADYGVWFENGV
jgi:hypothetical protein